MYGYIGLDIGGTKILGSLYNEAGKLLGQIKKKTKAHEGQAVVLSQIEKVLDYLFKVSDIKVKGIGAGAPGIIKDGRVVVFSPNLPFSNFDMAKYIESKFDVPVIIGNDVNVAMYGEWKASDMGDISHVLGVFPGTGVGGAIIIDKKLYVGQGGAGEIGHMIVNPEGMLCGCGSSGCLESYASKTGIQKAVLGQIRKGRKTVLKQALEDPEAIIKSSILRAAYLNKDEVAVEVLERCAYYLGIAVGNLVNIFHPQLIILGGGLMEALGDELMPLILKTTKSNAMAGLVDDVTFKLAKLGDDAGVYGAYQLILDKMVNP